MADIPNGDSLILQLFTYFFDIGAKPGIAREIEYHMSDILVQLVAECNSLPSEVVDIIVAQFLRATPTATAVPQGKKHGKGEDGKQTSIREHMAPPPPAYNMARQICTSISCVDKMARHICQYFSEVILDASPSSRSHHHRRSSLSPDPHESPEPAGPHEPSEDDLKELGKAHLLVKELWRAAPSVLQNVIPQLEQELMADNVQLRLLAAETIGEMCATSPSPPLGTGIMGGATVGSWGGNAGSGSFASTCPSTWKLWLGRMNDKSWVVRSKWVECAVRVLQTLTPNTAAGVNAAQALVPLIADKLNDSDERVRLATCRSIGEDLDYASVKTKLNKANGGEKLLENLALRAKDKKHGVRAEGMRVLAKIWDSGYEDIRRGEESVVKLLGWIPGSLLETSYVNDKDVNVLLDCVMWEVLLPLEYPPGCLDTGKKKLGAGAAAANGKGTKKKKKVKEVVAKKVPTNTRTLREKKPPKPKNVLDFDDSGSELTDPPESEEEEEEDSSEEEEEDEEEEAGNKNNGPASLNSATLDQDHQRTIRLLHLAHNLSPRSLRALLALASRQLSYSAVLTPFLAAAADFNAGGANTLTTTTTTTTADAPSQADLKARLTKLIDWLAAQFPDSARAREHLWKWVKLGDRRGWTLVRGMLSVDASWVQVVGNLKEVVRRIEKSPGGGGGSLETVLPLLYRSALTLWNKSHVPTIVAMSKEAAAGQKDTPPDQDILGGGGNENALASTANVLLKEMSAHLPAVFKAHIASLTTIIQETAPPAPGSRKALAASAPTTPIDPSIVDTLSALSTFAKRYPTDVPSDRKLHQALFALATSPLSTPTAAKHAVRVLMCTALNRREMYAADLVQRCLTEWGYGGEGFLVRLAAVAEMVMVAPAGVLGEKGVQVRIKEICLKECLLRAREVRGEKDAEWVAEGALSEEGRAKVLALKVLVNLPRAAVGGGGAAASQEATQLATSVLAVLEKILVNEGEVPEASDTPRSHRAHLRLAAAKSLLKLAATSPVLDELITPKLFNLVALTAQDRREHVRRRFLGRLKKLLASGRLSPRWYAIVFLVAHEPVEELREETGVWIRARAKVFAATAVSATKKSTGGTMANTMELLLSRLLSLLAHHPDFPSASTAPAELLDMARYLAYYIRSVVNSENIGVVYYIAGYLKRVRDGIAPEGAEREQKSENLYMLSELAQAMCRRWKEMNEGWVIESWPGKIALPKGLFVKLPGGEKQIGDIRKTVFLPKEVDGKVLDAVLREKKAKGGAVVEKGVNGDGGAHAGPGAKKRKSDAGATPNTKKRRQSKSAVDEDGGDGDDGDDGKGVKKVKTPRKRKAVPGTGTPKTPAKTPKRRRKSGGGEDDEEGMSTVERRRSGRVSTRNVVYKEDEEDDGTGEELEESDEEDEDSGEESGEEGSGEEEEEDASRPEEVGGDKMDVDDDGDDEEPEKPSSASKKGRGRPKETIKSPSENKHKTIQAKAKAARNSDSPAAKRPTRGRGRPRKVEEDRDGDEKMSDGDEASEGEGEGADEEEAEEEGGDSDGEGETLEQALSKPATREKRISNGAGKKNKEMEVEAAEEEEEAVKSPVKQMVVGRVTRRGGAAGK